MATANVAFEPGEKVLIVFDNYNENDKMKAIRPMHEGEIVELKKLRDSNQAILFGSIDTYSAVVVESAVYVIQWQRELYRIKPFDENPTWEYLRGPKEFHGAEPPAVTLDGCIYVCGGGFERAEVYRKTDEELSKVTKSCEKYNPAVGQWEKIKNMHCEKRLNAMVEANGHIYSIGGIGRQKNKTYEVALYLVEKYDKESDEWSPMPRMKKSRIAPAVASYNGKIYVLGGGVEDEDNPRLLDDYNSWLYLASLEFFDLNSEEWVMAKKVMTSPRIKFRACVFDDKIYAVGGNKDNKNNAEQANIQDIRREADVKDQSAKAWKVTDWIGEMSKWNYMATLLMHVPTEEMQVD
uniref:kelch-like protein 12 n=1 Tax=Styela clava TaxID=7725 RepID=UPI0019396BC4|nr:kelch-like protein 12 [Styela clava]